MKKSRQRFVFWSTLVILAFLLAAAPATWCGPPQETLGVSGVTLPDNAKGKPPSWTGKAFRQGVVAVANPHGAEAGAKILEAGGNAVDAAVAIAYALNVVEPQSAGIGGGGFMMIHIAATGQTVFIDSREKAPAGATRNMFVGVSSPSTKGVSCGVPGMVRGTALALAQYGRLSLAEVMQPAIKLAEDGFAATPRYVAASCNSRALNYPETMAYFCPDGVNPRVDVGEIVTNPNLADTFKVIAAQGPDAFYSGDIAKGIVEGQKRYYGTGKSGTMTEADLANYQPAVRVPVVATYRGYTIKSMTSPSSGGLTILQMLKMLERFPIGDSSQGFGFGETNTLHVMIEAMRLAYADRAVWMGDADFAYVPAVGLLDPVYVALRGGNIHLGSRISPNPTAGDPRPYDVAAFSRGPRLAVADPVTGPGETTTHFCVVDKWGNLVSYTNTIESSHGFGAFAGYTQDGQFRNFGFLLNNELTDFNTTPSTNPYTGTIGTNDVEPMKRPRSSMAPTMIFDPQGRPVVALGSPGGATIINSVLQVIMNLIDHNMTLQAAIDVPRISVTAASGATSMEPGFQQDVIDALIALGHSISVASVSDIGSIQAVIIDLQTGKQYGGADARREGTVIGLPRPQGNK